MPNATTNEKEILALQAQVSELAAQISETNSLIRSLIDGQGVQTQLINKINAPQLPQTHSKSESRELPVALEAAEIKIDTDKVYFNILDGKTCGVFRGQVGGRFYSFFINHRNQNNDDIIDLLREVKDLNVNPADLVVSADPAWKKNKNDKWECVYYVSSLSVVARQDAPQEQLVLQDTPDF